MIRPITCVTFLLACASGLYLYQSKHRVQLLDREIEQTVHATDALREQTRVLHAEWTLLNDPQRLQALADQFLNLKTVAPGQFTSLAELGNRLPAARPFEPPQDTLPASIPVAAAPVPAEGQGEERPAPPPAVSVATAAPVPPKPVALPLPPRVVEPRPNPPHSAPVQVAASRPVPEPRPQAESRIATASFQMVPTRAVPVAVPAPQPVAPMGGSLLGMAHPQASSLPPPTPMNLIPWNSNGGGGN